MSGSSYKKFSRLDLQELVKEIQFLFSSTLSLIKVNKARIILFWFLVMIFSFLLIQVDYRTVHWFWNAEENPWRSFSRKLSYWGDFQTGSLILFIIFWCFGKFYNKTKWRNIAIACFLSSAMAGASAHVLKYTLGRPRPHVEVEDTFRGFTKDHNYHSFPSGHSATSMGSAIPILIAAPNIGIPVFVGAGLVCWSRIHLGRHYLSDVFSGASFGVFFGFLFGYAVRCQNKD
jgi:membrane-associated phospholipid phosphatase